MWLSASYTVLESWLYMAPSILNRVKELRNARGWTQEEFARAVGVSRQSINSIERERYVPSLLLAMTFAKIFECRDGSDFYAGEGKMKIPFLGRAIDERFLNHRLKSSSLGGIVGGVSRFCCGRTAFT